jgi:hypothetical protein
VSRTGARREPTGVTTASLEVGRAPRLAAEGWSKLHVCSLRATLLTAIPNY